MVRKTWFYVPECPLAGDCSRQAFKKAQCFGETEEAARAAVRRHLEASGLHKLSHHEAGEWAAYATIIAFSEEEPEEDELEVEVELDEPPQKRQRGGSSGGKGGQGKGDKGKKDFIANVVKETVQQLGSSARGSSGSGVVTVRRAELQMAVDSMARAATAAKQAQRISTTAARAFGDEAAAFEECRVKLELLLDQ